MNILQTELADILQTELADILQTELADILQTELAEVSLLTFICFQRIKFFSQRPQMSRHLRGFLISFFPVFFH